MQGHEKSMCKTSHLIFHAIKLDILLMLKLLSKVLQDNSLLTPEFITAVETTILNVTKISTLIESKEENAFLERSVFRETKKLLKKIDQDGNVIIIERQTRVNHHFDTGKNVSINGYRMRGSVEGALKKSKREFIPILDVLKESLITRFSSILENAVFKFIASFLDTKSYQFTEIDEVYQHVSIIANFFSEILNANGCDIDALRNEFTIVHTHVIQFLSATSTERCWKRLFQMKNTLGIINILHIAELSIVIPLSNAESERVYSFMWRVFCQRKNWSQPFNFGRHFETP